jgi:hypothetical protein
MTGISGALAAFHLTGVLALAGLYLLAPRLRMPWYRPRILWAGVVHNAGVAIMFFGLGAWALSLVPGVFLVLALAVLGWYTVRLRVSLRRMNRQFRSLRGASASQEEGS